MLFSRLLPAPSRSRFSAIRRLLLCVTLVLCVSTCLTSPKTAIAAAAASRTEAGTVTGTVTDPLGAAVYNARVDILTVNGIMLPTHGHTDGRGQYSVFLYRSGRYRVRVVATGFNVTQSPEVYVSLGKTAFVDIALQFGQLEQKVTVTANGIPTPQTQTGASTTIVDQSLYPYALDVQDTLRRVSGLQFATNGQRGAATSLFEMGGDSNATDVLLDGIPINDIGGGVNFAYLPANGISQEEVYRGPDSALYGANASAGVVALTTSRGTTAKPLLQYAIDAGNFGTYHQEASLGGTHKALDYFGDFARIDTSNSYPNSTFHNASSVANVGYALTPRVQLRATAHRVSAATGEPNAILFYGIPDVQYLKDHDLYGSATLEDRQSDKLDMTAQYGLVRLRSLNTDPAPVGVLVANPNAVNNCGYDNQGNPVTQEYLGLPVTIRGANGTSASGQAFYACPNTSYPGTDGTLTNHDFFYGQTTYKNSDKLTVLGAFRYDSEHGYTAYDYLPQSASRGNYDYIVQTFGNLGNRLYYSAGTDLPNYSVFGFQPTPHATAAYYLTRPTAAGLLSGTKLRFNYSQGILEPTIAEQRGSIYDVLNSLPNGQQLLAQHGINPVGAQQTSTYETGLDQNVLGTRALLHGGYYRSSFTNQIEFVDAPALLQLGVPQAIEQVISNTSFGAYINSLSFSAQGVETSAEYRVTQRLYARGGYTLLNANVQKSYTSDNSYPSYNPAYPNTPIGAYSPLVGQRPFRRAQHTGYFEVIYARPRWYMEMTGNFSGRRDDSTFLLDANGGSTLLLPNRNLDPAYQNIGLTVHYRVNRHVSSYTVMDNLLSQHYQQVFGYPSLPFNFRSGLQFAWGGDSVR
ncbi:MAG TPA: TonB-dependent receptor plug domain-containing protein [Acidobacteriaceae bacterium]|nr:TonB-dependent receptor plug domain-containing protein [Acidobacteriaceae bacterium]